MFKSVAPCKKQLIQIPPAAAIGKLALILLSLSNLQCKAIMAQLSLR